MRREREKGSCDRKATSTSNSKTKWHIVVEKRHSYGVGRGLKGSPSDGHRSCVHQAEGETSATSDKCLVSVHPQRGKPSPITHWSPIPKPKMLPHTTNRGKIYRRTQRKRGDLAASAAARVPKGKHSGERAALVQFLQFPCPGLVGNLTRIKMARRP
jgi:hypothetical protein